MDLTLPGQQARRFSMQKKGISTMATHTVKMTSPLPTAHLGANIATCALVHRTHYGTCPGCQQLQALRYVAQLNAATIASARWQARLR